jgi:hypothetical protein
MSRAGSPAWGLLLRGREHAALWHEHREAIVAGWIGGRPGSRPHAWWRRDATEPRELVAGAGRVVPWGPDRYEWIWRNYFGLPHTIDLDVDDPPVFESEAAYLRRLSLLEREETRRLRPSAFEPEGMQIIVADWVTPPRAIGYRPFSADGVEGYVGDGLSDGIERPPLFNYQDGDTESGEDD